MKALLILMLATACDSTANAQLFKSWQRNQTQQQLQHSIDEAKRKTEDEATKKVIAESLKMPRPTTEDYARVAAEGKAERAKLEFSQAVNKSFTEVAAQYPALNDFNSPLYAKYLHVLGIMKEDGDPALTSASYPKVVAERAAFWLAQEKIEAQARQQAQAAEARTPTQAPTRASTVGTPQGIIAAGGRASLWQPSDPTQDKLDAIQRQLDMQAEQAKLDAFRQHQIENAEQFRRTVERLQR